MISVVMSAYNASAFIGQAIESILNQTFHDFELIVVDDGSADNTFEIVSQYCNHDSRVRPIQIQNSGKVYARNLGAKEAKYPWLAIMDSDDIALPERLEKQISFVKINPRIVALGSYSYDIGATGKVLRRQSIGVTSEEDFHTARKEGHIPFVRHSTALIQRSAFFEVGGYDSQFDCAEDFDLFYRLGEKGLVLAIPEPLILYRVHASSESSMKFWRQYFLMRYIYAKNNARLKSQEEPSLQQFIEEERHQPVLEQTRRNLDLFVRFWYRKGGLFLSERPQLYPILDFFMAITSNPLYTTEKDWKHKLSPETRLAMEKVGCI